jgi:endonuclease/exonuclease/phosphatase family metal-dependent hydrolase
LRVRRPLPGRLATVIAAACTMSGILIAVSSTASASWLMPMNMRIVSIGSTSVTVTSDAPTTAVSYRLFASTYQPDVWWVNLDSGRHSSSLVSVAGSRPTLTITGLTYTSAPVWFRLEAVSRSAHSYSPNIGMVGLRPPTPTNARMHSSRRGTYLSWDGPPASGYDVQQAIDRGMTRQLKTYYVRARSSATRAYTPGARGYGQSYYWRVRAWNHGTSSGWTAPAFAKVANHLWSVRLMSYNLLNRAQDGRTGPCGVRIAPWSTRKATAVRNVVSYQPDLMALQEAGQKASSATTQGQDVVRGSGAYRIADTDLRDRNVPWSGNFIAYKPSVYRPVQRGGHWMLSSSRVVGVFDAVYQEFQSRQKPSVDFLVVDTHLPSDVGFAVDQLRYKETTFIVQKARALAARRGGIPVLYAGDFNSFPSRDWHPIDGPHLAMRNANIASGDTVAGFRWNTRYASRNRYCYTPPADGVNLDYLYVSPGVVASSWGIVLNLNSRGQFTAPIASDHNAVAGIVKIPY